jgi:hypothetical protein
VQLFGREVAVGTAAAIACFVEMRALSPIAAFLLASLGFCPLGRAEMPMLGPGVSLSLALDWNRIAATALAHPEPAAPPARAHRHEVPRLTVTTAALPPAPRDVAVYGRVAGWAQSVVMPGYVAADLEHRQRFRQVYVAPYAPYFGAYGLTVTVETDAILR